jgi:gamma-glutamyl-gamma-aminobutyrate hydrolase PuuD
MSNNPFPIRVGIYGQDNTPKKERHGCGLWMAGYSACVEAAEGVPVFLPETPPISWGDTLADVQGVLIIGHDGDARRALTNSDTLVRWCRENEFPILGVDHGMHALNTAFNGTVYQDVGREFPEALQHRHPPERGLRHAINVVAGTRLCDIYGEGEIVVNSEHRRAVQRLARGFRASATALDGIIESIESEREDWFALGIQWNPASATASGLDIQVFRGLVNAARRRAELVSAVAA